MYILGLPEVVYPVGLFGIVTPNILVYTLLKIEAAHVNRKADH